MRATGFWAQSARQGTPGLDKTTIMLSWVQDGITNGGRSSAFACLALVLVSRRYPRVIPFVLKAKFVTYAPLSDLSSACRRDQMPGTARLAVAMGHVAFGLDLFAACKRCTSELIGRAFAVHIFLPRSSSPLTFWLAGRHSLRVAAATQ